MFKMNFVLLVLVAVFIDKISCDCTGEIDCTVNDTCPEEGECKLGYVLSSDGSKCLPYTTQYYGQCYEDAQCKDRLGEHVVCKDVCACEDGYRWLQGECKAYVGFGESCTDSSECFDGYNLQSLSCVSGTCSCSQGYYQRSDTDCRKVASKEGDICALDIDCQFEGGTKGVCQRGVCVGASVTLLPTESIEEEIIEQIVSYTQVRDQKFCESDDDCTVDIPNSECFEKTGTCVCKKEYFFDNEGTQCIPELGVFANCKNDSDCSVRPGKCEDGVCYCRDYYFTDDSKRNCVKTMSQQNWNCLSREWCYALGQYAFCSTTETCNCSKVAHYDEENTYCRLNGQTDLKLCATDYDCKYALHSFCVDETCKCEENYEWQDNVCVPLENKIGLPCCYDPDCRIENSGCISGKCQCLENYLSSVENDICYPIRHQLGDDCQINSQCYLGITYSECVNGTCECFENYLGYNDHCYEKKEYNSYCNNLIECSLSLGDTFQCRNRMCQCPTGYDMIEDKCSSGNIKMGNYFIVVVALILKGLLGVFC